jgi:hypothetical protein
MVLGWIRKAGGRRFEPYVPDESDRGGHPADAMLVDAMRESTRLAREHRDGERQRKRAEARKAAAARV